jgi:hypothetical protein
MKFLKYLPFLFLIFFVFTLSANPGIQWKTLDVEISPGDSEALAAKSKAYVDSKECSGYEDGMNVSEGTFFEAVDHVTPLLELTNGTIIFQRASSLKILLSIRNAQQNVAYKLSTDKLFIVPDIERTNTQAPTFVLTNLKSTFKIDITIEVAGEPKPVMDMQLFSRCINTKKPNRAGDYTEADKQDCRYKSKKLEPSLVVLPLDQSTLNLYFADIQEVLGRAICLKTKPSTPIIYLD